MEHSLNDLEIASPSVVRQAARDFAAVLAETPQFKTYEETAFRLRGDKAAQAAIQAYQSKQQSLQALLMLNAAPPHEQAELERLRLAFLGEPSVSAFLRAQEDLTAVFQSAANLLSQHIGLNFTAACGPGCC